MATQLIRAFMDELGRKSGSRAPSSPRSATRAFGWSTRELAERMGRSERTARRYLQQNRVPAGQQARWRQVTADAASARMRRNIEQRGLRSRSSGPPYALSVEGLYRVSSSRYRSHPSSPVRVLPGNGIPGSVMREVFGLVDAGQADAADAMLADALALGYGMPGGSLEILEVDGLDFHIG